MNLIVIECELAPDGSFDVVLHDEDGGCDYCVNINYRESTASLVGWAFGTEIALDACSERLQVEMWAAHDDGLRAEYQRMAREMSLAETA